jgi:hypothetical protein
MDGAGCMAVYRQKELTIGTTRPKAAQWKNVNDPWKLTPISSSLSNWLSALE